MSDDPRLPSKGLPKLSMPQTSLLKTKNDAPVTQRRLINYGRIVRRRFVVLNKPAVDEIKAAGGHQVLDNRTRWLVLLGPPLGEERLRGKKQEKYCYSACDATIAGL